MTNTLDLLVSVLADYITLGDPDECLHILNLEYLILHVRTHKNLHPIRKSFDCTHCLCALPKSVITSVVHIMQFTNHTWTNTYLMLVTCAVDEKKDMRFILD